MLKQILLATVVVPMALLTVASTSVAADAKPFTNSH